MFKRVLPASYAGLFLSVIIFTRAANATSYNDYYVGGSVVGTPNVDTLQGTNIHTFEIYSLDVSHSGNNLNVTIKTAYAGHDGFEQTNYGALFIKTNGPILDAGNNPVRPDASHAFANDTSTARAGNFDYAVVLPGGLGTGSKTGNNASLDSLKADGSNIQISYWPNSNVNNNSNNSGGIFRNGQAVGVKGNPTVVDGNVSYSIIEDLSISFTISNIFNQLGPEFSLAWEMTCGNDVIFVDVYKRDVECTNCVPGQTPLPATLPLFASGLGVLGFVVQRRKRKVLAN